MTFNCNVCNSHTAAINVSCQWVHAARFCVVSSHWHTYACEARGFNILQWKKEMARKNDKKQEPHRQAMQGMQLSTLLKSQITAPQFSTSLLRSPYFQSCTHCANTQFLFSPCCSSSRQAWAGHTEFVCKHQARKFALSWPAQLHSVSRANKLRCQTPLHNSPTVLLAISPSMVS